MKTQITTLLFPVLAALLLAVSSAQSQTDPASGGQRQGGRRQRQGNVDPAQFQQRMMDRYRERLEVKDDTEWKAIEPLIKNLADARMAVGGGMGRGGPGRGGGRGGDGNATPPPQTANPARENPAAQQLQKAVDSKASSAEIKAALNKYLEYRKSKQADLEKAQAALRAVLTSRQEALAVLSGLL
jgi:hypothetical protein